MNNKIIFVALGLLITIAFSQYNPCPNQLDTFQFGQCYRKYDYYCVGNQRIIRNYCPFPRTFANCPNAASSIPFVSAVCGVTKTGELVDFDKPCQACKRLYIDYYYNQPCSTVPRKCSHGEVCRNGACVLPNICDNIVCPSFAQCNNGFCVPIPNYCVSLNECSTGFACIGNRCIPAPSQCDNVECPADQRCVAGQCVDPCQDIVCAQGFSCSAGACSQIPGFCFNDSFCPKGQKCINNKCYPLA